MSADRETEKASLWLSHRKRGTLPCLLVAQSGHSPAPSCPQSGVCRHWESLGLSQWTPGSKSHQKVAFLHMLMLSQRCWASLGPLGSALTNVG